MAMRWDSVRGEAVFGRYSEFKAATGEKALAPWAKDAHGRQPQVELSDFGTHYQLDAEVPGVDVGDLRLVIEPDYILLEGRWSASPNGSGERGSTKLVSEIAGGPFMRVVRFPETTDGNAASAVLENGVLTITLPKKEEL